MKKLHSIMMLLALMVAAFSFTACSDDDDNDNKGSVDASIVGRWKLIATDVDPEEALEQGFVATDDLSIMDFNANGDYSGYSEYGDETESGSWRIDGNRLYATPSAAPIPFSYTILLLNETTLRLETKVTTFLYNEQAGELEEAEVTIQSTYTRIS